MAGPQGFLIVPSFACFWFKFKLSTMCRLLSVHPAFARDRCVVNFCGDTARGCIDARP